MTEYTAGTCEYCSGTGLRDAETLCPTCDGSGGRLPITAESVDAALEAVGLSEFEAATGGI